MAVNLKTTLTANLNLKSNWMNFFFFTVCFDLFLKILLVDDIAFQLWFFLCKYA